MSHSLSAVFSLAVGFTVGYSTAVSKLRRPFLSDRYFFITVRLLQRRTRLTDEKARFAGVRARRSDLRGVPGGLI